MEDLDGILRRLQKEYPASYGSKRGLLAVPYAEELTRNFSQALWVLLGAVALLLLIACANLANLMLVRATERRRDMAIRQALGASRSELVRQLLVESVLLSLGGAILGALLARWTVPVAGRAQPGGAAARARHPRQPARPPLHPGGGRAGRASRSASRRRCAPRASIPSGT